MAKKAEIQIYKSFTKRKKTYLVFDLNYPDQLAYDFAKKFFRCSMSHILFVMGFLNKGELYLEDPDKPGTKIVGVMYYVR